MEVFRFSILPLADIERRQAFKEAVNNCPHCGEHLLFKHEYDFMENTVHEVAECEKCQAHIREENHKVQ